MQQILMAFGSVIGMNIFFLILPYINNIAFFNIYLIDAIVSIVVMVTGLMIIKSLISFFSGLVGGADALKEEDANRRYGAALINNEKIEKDLAKALDEGTASSIASETFNREYGKALKANGGDEEAAYQKALKEAAKADSAIYRGNEDTIKYQRYSSTEYSTFEEAQKIREKAKEYSSRQKAISEANYLNEFGQFDMTSLHQSMANSLRIGGGTLAKALLEGMLPALKIDPNKIAGITRFASNKKYDDKGNFTGYYWTPKQYTADDRAKKLKYNPAGDLGKLSYLWGGNKVAKPDKSTEKQTLEATQENARVTEQTSKQQIKLLRDILKKLP